MKPKASLICLLICLTMTLLLSTQAYAQEPSFSARHSYKEALRLAEQLERPVMLFFWNIYCDACEELNQTVLSSEAVLTKLDEQFVVAWVDTLNLHNHKILDRYKVRGTPTLIFLGSSLEELGRSYGMPKEAFLPFLDELIPAKSDE